MKLWQNTSALSGLVGLVLSPLRDTMHACDGAMKSLRSPIRSVAENFSDISPSPYRSVRQNCFFQKNPLKITTETALYNREFNQKSKIFPVVDSV